MAGYVVHPRGLCESHQVGDDTAIGAFSHVLAGARIGRDCRILDYVCVADGVVLGDRVTVHGSVQLPAGLVVEDDAVIGAQVSFALDEPAVKGAGIRIGSRVSIGTNTTIYPGVKIESGAVIMAGSVVTRSVPPNARVSGNPACIVGYVSAGAEQADPLKELADAQDGPAVLPTAVQGVTLHRLPLIHDLRGDLSVGEFGRNIPFEVRRYFLVFDVPSAETRGEHAHLQCHQFLICVKGSCAIVADDGRQRQEFLLDRPNLAVHLPPMVWGIQYKYSADAVLLVFASHYYDPADYIRNYDDFLQRCRQGGA